jgi:hypothetical protein
MYCCLRYPGFHGPAWNSVKQPIALRIEAGLLAAVRRCAAEENRSLTNFIETVLKVRVTGQSRPLTGPPVCEVNAASLAPAVPPSGRTARKGRRPR